jgi:pyruvate formate lyase activating enzyme
MKKNIPFLAAVAALASLCVVSSWGIPFAQNDLKEALFYEKRDSLAVQCHICPRNCVIPNKGRGFCNARENRDGVLYTLVYAHPVSMHVDPMEKKPLFHFLPGTTAFSIATAGCNLRCKFCQNWEISQAKPEEVNAAYLEPEAVIAEVQKSGARTIAYTYTEPTIFFEYMLDIAKLARQQGIRNVMHSCGYINEEPLRMVAKYLDAANIDLKGFSEEFYAKMSEATLAPVLRSLEILKEEGVHVEITNLIVPGYNDDPEMIRKMCVWIKEKLGADTPLHLSRFFPMFKLLNLNPTPVAALERARAIALEVGLHYVYVGNVAGETFENTYCPQCGKLLIGRRGYFVTENHIKNGQCEYCGYKIEGVWE